MRARVRMKETFRRFCRDRSAAALIYVTITLPVLIGFGLLAVDFGRLTTLQSTLQHGADALALAGAAELDRRPDAIDRANRAITELITTNKSLFGTTLVTIKNTNGAVSFDYYATLPSSDAVLLTGALPKSSSTEREASSLTARYIEVRVTPVNFNTIFPASFLGGTNSTSARASAVAGFDAAVCDFTPMFICNPYESATNTNISDSTELFRHFDRVNYPDRIGRLINMKQTGGSTAQYFPGNFGFLVPPGASNPGASTLREYVGMAVPPACFVANGVELRTGAIESIRFGFNVRFDMYDGPMNGNRNNPDYRPAQNVRKGMANDKDNGQGSACNPDDAASAAHSGLLRDTCFNSNSCPYMSGRMGDGVWDKATYWSEAHNGESLPGDISGTYVTRYDVYQYELADMANRVQNDSNSTPLGGEVGYPACYNGASGTVNNSPDRRIFHAAVLNCRALDTSVAYGPIQGGSSNMLPVLAFVKFFITEPVGGDKTNTSAADGDVWAEMVGIDMPGQANSVARDIVQLYR